MCVQSLDYSSNDPKVFGPHYWYVLHSMAQRYPNTPNQSDKETYRLTVNNLLKYMPGCDKGCYNHSQDYISKNPMALDSRQSIVDWTSNFHDSQNPKTIEDKTGGEPIDPLAQPPKDEVKSALKKSKEAKKALFLALCKKYNVPEPSGWKNEVCPTNPATSCIVYDERDPSGATPHVNPFSDSDKQVIHEFDHYRELRTSGKISDEKTAETFAYGILQESYPTKIEESEETVGKIEEETQHNQEVGSFDQKIQQQEKPQEQQTEESKGYREVAEAWDKPTDAYSKGFSEHHMKTNPQETPMHTEPNQAAHSMLSDESTPGIADIGLINQTARPTNTQTKPKKLSKWEKTIEDIVGNSAVAVGSIDDSLEGDTSAGYAERFPNYARAMREAEMARKEKEIDKKLNEGFISYLDPVYQFPAKALGIKPGQLNLAHTPNIIMNVVQTLIESNTTPIGAGLFAFLTGVSLFVTGYLGKASISFRDQLALQNISAAFLWRTLQYINPKYEMKKDLKKMYQRIQDGDFRLSDSFIETPGMWKKKQNKMKNAWTNMPHYLGKDEKGRPAFIIPAPAAFATMGMSSPGAPMATGTPDYSSLSAIHSGGNIGGINVSGHSSDSSGEPIYNLGSGYYDIGQPGDEWELPPFQPAAGSIGPIDPDVMRNVSMVG